MMVLTQLLAPIVLNNKLLIYVGGVSVLKDEQRKVARQCVDYISS